METKFKDKKKNTAAAAPYLLENEEIEALHPPPLDCPPGAPLGHNKEVLPCGGSVAYGGGG